jgi:pyridoxamine 5'-phosphate oxidase
MKDRIWKEVIEELQASVKQANHPFKFATLATLGLERLPRLRTIKIREFDPESLQITFYTDSRSKKILHIKENNKVSMLLYHPDSLLQLRLEGLAIRERDDEVLGEHWSRVDRKAQKDYTTVCAPGTEIQHPEKIEYLEEDAYFTMVYILPYKVEYLKLKRPNHLRVRYSKRDGIWKSDFLVP